MNVVFDARWIPERPSGIGHYATELIRALAAGPGGERVTLLFHRESLQRRVMEETGAARVPGIAALRVRWSAEHPLSQAVLPGLLRRLRADVFHSPNYLVPVAAFPAGRPGRIRCVATIHDLIPLRHPEYTPHARKTRFHAVYRELLRACAARIDLALAPSAATRRDLQDCLGMPPNRIRITPEAAAARFTPDPSVERRPGEILFVGRSDPYKNLAVLIEALALLRQAGVHGVRLRVLGETDPRYPEPARRAAALGLDDAVRWEGHVSGDALAAAYRRAAVLAMPSRMEGFGLPVLEAMACGTPVVCSNRGSLPEVAGEAALRVDPDDPERLAAALRRVLEDPGLAADLSGKGLRRAAQFDWARTAALTRAAWAEALRLDPAIPADPGNPP